MKLIGYCKGCEKVFCAQHRYPETHNCIKLLEMQLNKKEELIKRLHSEAFVKNKVTRI
jgi:predicted nucleic acid binding AN1-type Zn finger protein